MRRRLLFSTPLILTLSVTLLNSHIVNCTTPSTVSLIQSMTLTHAHTVSAKNSASAMPPMKGMTVCTWSAEAYNSSDFDQSIANLANIKANWVTFTVFWFMDTYTDTEIQPRPDLYTASNSSLIHAIQKAHELGMKVALKPMVDLVHADGHWRGDINPTSWTLWFENYRSFINSYADLAEENNVTLFEVGTELRSSQPKESEWRQVISEVRTHYSKNITYAANWDSYSTYASLPGYAVKFWDALDYVGVDAYFPLTDSYNPTVEQLINAWSHAASGWWGTDPNWTEDLYSTYLQTSKEIIFTEIGYISQNGTNTQPWGGFSPPHEIDLQEQADCYQAALEVFKDKEWFEGWFWWNWETDPDAGLPGDPNYDWYPPQNKPAEDILYEYYSRPRAHVKTKPNNQEGILHLVNVTAFNGTTKITSGISNKSGIVTLTNLPIGDITFVAYAKSDYSQVIASVIVPISSESQNFDLICDQNYGDVSNSWETIITAHARVELATLDPNLTSPSGTYRWLDVADYTYGSDYRDSYNYSQATVEVTYKTVGNVLKGTLTASNLKPNFAYQLKLVGTPGSVDNERIGLAGRWWQEEWDGSSWSNGQNLNNKGDGSSPNPNDIVYFDRCDDPDPSSPTGYHYRYTAYLVFDYFITDSSGSATLHFETGSCYHVLWKTSQRTHSINDGPLKTVTFDPDPSEPAYDTDYPNTTVDIFGEWERLPMGGVHLQPGEYNCQIILTEESFHGSGGSLSGNWAGAMGADITFTIVGP